MAATIASLRAGHLRSLPACSCRGAPRLSRLQRGPLQRLLKLRCFAVVELEENISNFQKTVVDLAFFFGQPRMKAGTAAEFAFRKSLDSRSQVEPVTRGSKPKAVASWI